FQYIADDGERKSIESNDVNEYLKVISGESFTAKDFRTWAGTVKTAAELCNCPPCRSQTAGRKNIVTAIKTVAADLGNTTAVCRKSYIHPIVFDAYMSGEVIRPTKRRLASSTALSAQESAVVALIERFSRRRSKSKAA